MRSVLIHASVPDLLTALQEITEAFVPVSLATQEIPMELPAHQVSLELWKLLLVLIISLKF